MKKIIFLLLIMVGFAVAGTPPSPFKKGTSRILNKDSTLQFKIIFPDGDSAIFPSTGGTSGQILKLGANGALSWGSDVSGGSGLFDTLGTSDTIMYALGSDTLFFFYTASGWAVGRSGLSVVDSLEANDFIRFIDGTDSLTLTPALVDSIVNQKGVYASGSGSTDSLYVRDSITTIEGWKQSGDTIFIDSTQYLALQDTGTYTTTLQVLMGDSARQAAADSIALAFRLVDTNTYTLRILLSSDTAIGDTSALLRTILGQITDDTTNYQTAYGWGDHSIAGYMSDDMASIYKYFSRVYFDTLADASGDSLVVIFADSTGKIDTAYAPLVTLIQNHSDSGVTGLDSAEVVTIVTDSGFAKLTDISTNADSIRGVYVNSTPTTSEDGYVQKYYSTGDSIGWAVDNTSPVLNNVLVNGDLGVLGNFYVTNFANYLDLENVEADHNDNYVTLDANSPFWNGIDSLEAMDSSFAVHPSNQYINKGFYGFESKKKLMVFTPFYTARAENPYLVWADAGTDDWSAITFNGVDSLSNPIFDTSDFSGSTHLSDPDIFFDDEDRLWMGFRVTYSSDSEVIVVTMFDTNAAGNPIMTTPVSIRNGGTNTDNISPAFILDTNSTYTMWIVEPRVNSTIDTSRVLRYTCSSTDSIAITAGWHFKDTTNFKPPHDTLQIWHIEVVPRSVDELIILATCTDTASTTGDSAQLYIGTSIDGGYTVRWADSTTNPVTPLLATSTGTADSLKIWGKIVYRSSGYWVDNSSGGYFNLYYSCAGGPNGNWHIAHTKMYCYPGINWSDTTSTIPTKNWSRDSVVLWTDSSGSGDNGFYNKTAANATFIEWTDTSGAGDNGIYNKTKADASFATKGTHSQKVYYFVDYLPGRENVTDDSVHLSLPIMNGIYATYAKDSNLVAVNSKYDTLYFTWGVLPYGITSIDSVVFTYKCSSVNSYINDLFMITPDHTAGSVMADSINTTDLIGTAINSTSWSRKQIGIGLSNQNAGDQFVLRMTNYIDNDGNIWIGRIYLVCSVDITL